MFNSKYWILLIITLIFAVIIISVKKFRFIDFQSLIMFWALGFALDMLFCKWLAYYHWVSMEYRGFYSFWACLIFYPSVALIFLKLRPNGIIRLAIYIALYVVSLTIFELYVIYPQEIIIYYKWRIIPWSPIGYTLVLAMIHIYDKTIEKRLKC